MQITLLNYTPLIICSNAIRTCYQSFSKSDEGGELDKALIEKVGNIYKHSSTLEHLVYTFYIKGISRACLQELARHRIASLSVKSTRYTLKELKSIDEIKTKDEASKWLVLTDNEIVDQASINALNNIIKLLNTPNMTLDIVKYALPESYKTELTWTINARSLQNFLKLRSSNKALWEIKRLAVNIYDSIPKEHKYLFSIYMNDCKD